MAISELLHASTRFNDYVRLVLRLRASSRRSPIYSANPLRRAVIHTPVVPAGALYDLFPADAVFAVALTRSTTTGSPPIQIKRRSILEAAMFALCYGPHALLALLWSGLLLPSFRSWGHPQSLRRISLHGSSFITMAGSSPAGLAALWAASRVGQRRARFRPTTSDVSALSSSVANSRQAVPTFPLPPLKFRTVGFPQYGFKPVCP